MDTYIELYNGGELEDRAVINDGMTFGRVTIVELFYQTGHIFGYVKVDGGKTFFLEPIAEDNTFTAEGETYSLQQFIALF
ncbi:MULTISPECIES: hypothetical protein [Exiguobacterium]|uniref:hypothetical protein n=1 Tax=Exiguobacterium TaxID=33986 RepID=UPI001BEBE607|nr:MULTISPECIES: hypothetical protein [Exiguobacterium]MCT4781878.1 hypothetical protein [Exiguobacterium himgiriensis]